MRRFRLPMLLTICVVSFVYAEQNTIRNPVAPNGHDPWVIRQDGLYYYCYSHRGAIWVNSSDRLQDAVQFKGTRVWRPERGKSWSRELWAPELHFLQGRWYIYVAADDGNNDNHRMYVLQSKTNNPAGQYTFKGKIYDSTDKWAIDGTVMQFMGKLYFIWSGWEGDMNVGQNLYIAPMSDPTTISGQRIMISKPEYDWEKIGDPLVNEGPEVLKHGYDLFIIYSASGSWTDDYCLGQLKLVGDDPQKPSSWRKKAIPVLTSSKTIFSPGHASFTKSLDETEDWIVFHTAKHKGAGWDRCTRIQPFTWDSNGDPNIGGILDNNVEIPIPSHKK